VLRPLLDNGVAGDYAEILTQRGASFSNSVVIGRQRAQFSSSPLRKQGSREIGFDLW